MPWTERKAGRTAYCVLSCNGSRYKLQIIPEFNDRRAENNQEKTQKHCGRQTGAVSTVVYFLASLHRYQRLDDEAVIAMAKWCVSEPGFMLLGPGDFC